MTGIAESSVEINLDPLSPLMTVISDEMKGLRGMMDAKFKSIYKIINQAIAVEV